VHVKAGDWLAGMLEHAPIWQSKRRGKSSKALGRGSNNALAKSGLVKSKAGAGDTLYSRQNPPFPHLRKFSEIRLESLKHRRCQDGSANLACDEVKPGRGSHAMDQRFAVAGSLTH
jgi:hypothetical protein